MERITYFSYRLTVQMIKKNTKYGDVVKATTRDKNDTHIGNTSSL